LDSVKASEKRIKICAIRGSFVVYPVARSSVFCVSFCFLSPKTRCCQVTSTRGHNVTFESHCLHRYHSIGPLGWIETESLAFVVGISVTVGVDFASFIAQSNIIGFSIALTLANPVCLAAVRCADAVPKRVAVPFRFPALSAKGIAFPVGRIFKPGYSLNT
jgi:hypothetical protein